MQYPTLAEERSILAATTGLEEPDLTPVLDAERVLALRRPRG